MVITPAVNLRSQQEQQYEHKTECSSHALASEINAAYRSVIGQGPHPGGTLPVLASRVYNIPDC